MYAVRSRKENQTHWIKQLFFYLAFFLAEPHKGLQENVKYKIAQSQIVRCLLMPIYTKSSLVPIGESESRFKVGETYF